MGLRFRRRLQLFPGCSVNIGRSGLSSVSVGARGAHLTVGRRGRRATVGLPGTGLSYSTSLHGRARRRVRPHHSVIAGLIALFVLYVLVRTLAGF